ncbi:uncharacterized protein MJAP1_003466 [Malassezia japonica]|uniref:Zinc finger CHCC-type domain-containing protein n=1 Tax=Malassezia japonica TaxID=223818 RepID=A0AAF0F0G7_9BASI|nr:uncharacterized protein MJAP1_003466 [Malassezia japonica]WFD40480.1 hypothetical protein MJAP1_003466 [Malassezia japonica]
MAVRAKSTSTLPTEAPPAPTEEARGDFVRPRVEDHHLMSNKEVPIAEPQTPPEVLEYGVEQAPNALETWSQDQRPKVDAMKGPRFEQVDMAFQPQSLSAMELISNVPIQMTTKRVVPCDGGDGPLGHPRVYINLDKPGPKGCPYCGIRYQKEEHHFHYVP